MKVIYICLMDHQSRGIVQDLLIKGSFSVVKKGAFF